MKICPLIAFNADTDILMFRNYDVPDINVGELRQGNLQAIRTFDGGKPTLDIIRGTCKEADCAWWSEERKCCGVVR